MNYRVKPNFFFLVIALIIGAALYNQFDFNEFTFEKPALAVVYGIVFVISIIGMIKRKKSE